MKSIRIFLLSQIVVLCASFAFGQDNDFELTIGEKNRQLQGQITTIPVFMTGDITNIDRFDFRIGYDNKGLELRCLTAGNTYMDSSNQIESHYRDKYVQHTVYDFFDSTGNGLYKNLSFKNVSQPGYSEVRVSGWLNDDTSLVRSKTEGTDSLELFTLHFYVTNDRRYECHLLPVQFIFDECTDNIIFRKSLASNGGSQFVAYMNKSYFVCDRPYGRHKYWIYDGTFEMDSTTPYYKFPQYDSRCAQKIREKHPMAAPSIDFYNGGVNVICSGLDIVGDINLNGLSMDDDDFKLFRKYILWGDSVFHINVEGQTAAADLNNDGICGSILDFQALNYLSCRQPVLRKFAKESYDGLLMLSSNGNGLTLSHKFDIPVGAILLKFLAPNSISEIDLDPSYMDFKVDYGQRNDTLTALIYSPNDQAKINAGPGRLMDIIFQGQRPQLISAEAAGYYGEKVDLKIVEH